MSQKKPSDQAPGKQNQVIEKLYEKYGPDEKFPVDPEEAGPKRSQKKAGQDLHDPQKEPDDGE